MQTVNKFSSKLLEQAVHEMSQLPGIGKRTALRLVLHLLKQPKESTSIAIVMFPIPFILK